MKELEQKHKVPTSIVKQQEKKYELFLENKIEPHNNHIVFEIDIEKMEATAATYQNTKSVHYYDILSKRKNLIKKDGCVYISALNFVNLKKKLQKAGIDTTNLKLIKTTHDSGSHLEVNILSKKP